MAYCAVDKQLQINIWQNTLQNYVIVKGLINLNGLDLEH